MHIRLTDSDALHAETAGPVVQEVIRPFSAHVAALNADRTRAPVSRCTPVSSQARHQPGRVAEVASYPGTVASQPREAAQQQQWKPPVSQARLQESTGAAGAGGGAAEVESATASEAGASAEHSALNEVLMRLQQQLLQRDTPPAPPALASADAMLPTGGPSHAYLGTAGAQTHTAGEQLLRHSARSSLRQGVSRKLQSAQYPGQHDTKASCLLSWSSRLQASDLLTVTEDALSEQQDRS